MRTPSGESGNGLTWMSVCRRSARGWRADCRRLLRRARPAESGFAGGGTSWSRSESCACVDSAALRRTAAPTGRSAEMRGESIAGGRCGRSWFWQCGRQWARRLCGGLVPAGRAVSLEKKVLKMIHERENWVNKKAEATDSCFMQGRPPWHKDAPEAPEDEYR